MIFINNVIKGAVYKNFISINQDFPRYITRH